MREHKENSDFSVFLNYLERQIEKLIDKAEKEKTEVRRLEEQIVDQKKVLSENDQRGQD